MNIYDVLKKENLGRTCSMYFKHYDKSILHYKRMFKDGVIDNIIDEDTIGVIIKGTQNFYIEELYYLYDILNAEFRLDDIYCYMESIDGGFLCYPEDKDKFLNATLCGEGTKEEIEEYFGIKILDNSICIPNETIYE